MTEVNLNGQSLDIVQENIKKLKQLFPEIVTEDKVDFEKLQAVLGNYVEKDNESYRFTWYGKSDSFRKSQTPSTGTLRPCIEDSRDWDNTQNLYIEGDNLEVLKLLQKSYNNQVKMIYIDPPYNKDKDFIYPDKWSDTIKAYKKITGQVDEEDNVISSDIEGEGGKHTNWLNMMYPRLRLANNLLKDDGVIFISVDDDEVENLKKLCNEVFGEENFIAKIVHKNNSMKNQTKLIGVTTEYILVYSKDKNELKNVQWRIFKKGAKDIDTKFKQLKGKGLSLEEIEIEIKEMYTRPKYSHLSRWNKVDENGVFKDADLSRENGYKHFTIINPETGKECVIPKRGWGKSYDELLRLQKENLIWYGDESTPPGMKDYITTDDVSVPDNFWYFDSSIDTRWLKTVFGDLVFENPKPIEMIRQLIDLHIQDNDIVIDFFSGSATTAHAVMQLNSEKTIKCRYIMVQLPENLDVMLEKADSIAKKTIKAAIKFLDSIDKPHYITELGKERIRRAGESIKAELTQKYEAYQQKQETLLDTNKEQAPMNPDDLDIGFKVLKLDDSNLKKWSVDVGEDFYKESKEGQNAILSEMLGFEVNNFVDGRSELDVVFEIMIKYGLDLNYPIETYTFDGKNVYSIGYGGLIICLDNDINPELADKIVNLIKDLEPSMVRVAVRDLSFNMDSAKTNFKETLKNGVYAYFDNRADKTNKENQFKFITI
ncbi:site-specific DNA-methyltransferase [Clostridium sp.]|uniref:site-specific DNA-methyltransferase n=1 Tax=Clostridium sp. TaxID=1506 RepID=UPI0032174AC4